MCKRNQQPIDRGGGCGGRRALQVTCNAVGLCAARGQDANVGPLL